jgi:Holliday junction resolvasome RuvABC endonuclease subunit
LGKLEAMHRLLRRHRPLVTHILTTCQPRSYATNGESKRFFLGLDIASKTTGYSILDVNGTPIESGIINTTKAITFSDYGSQMKQHFQNLAEKYGNAKWVIGVEEFVKRHRLTNANTLFKLCSCNTLASYEISNVFQTQPLRLSVSEARSFLKITSKEGDQKERVYHELKHLLPASYTPVFSSRNKEKLLPCNYDVTDSLLIAMYTAVMFRIQEKLSNTEELITFIEQTKTKSKNITTVRKKMVEVPREIFMKELLKDQDIITLFEKHLLELEYEKIAKLLK